MTFIAIWRTLGGMRELSALPEETRERALSRFHLIQTYINAKKDVHSVAAGAEL